MRRCGRCGETVESAFRFCPWCAAPQRLKVVEFFAAHPGTDPGKALRVSCYLADDPSERHARFSIWDVSGMVEAAVSLTESEARRLARFVNESAAIDGRRDDEDATQRLDFSPPLT